MSKQLASMRSNMQFFVDYESAELVPQIELILLALQPKYKASKEGFNRQEEVEELRITLTPKALNQLIANLQIQATQLQKFEQAGEALNSVIREMKVTK